MANAKRCDICGAFYESPICNDAVRIRIDPGYLKDRHIDLCDDCYVKLLEFIKPSLPENFSAARYRKEEKDDQRGKI